MSDLPNYLPGIPPIYGLKQPSPEFIQGGDVTVDFDLMFKDAPLIDISNWKLIVYVKKSNKANNILWNATIGDYLIQRAAGVNRFCFRIPSAITATFIPGAYHFAVKGIQKPGTGIPFDFSGTLTSGMFDLSLDASSPNPKLTTLRVTSVTLDPTDMTWKITSSSTEPTEPTADGGLT